MAMEEAVEQKVQGVVLQVMEGGAKLTVRCGAKLGKALIKGGWKATGGNILKALSNAFSNAVNTGHVSEKKLQSLGQDVHEINLANDTKKEVTRSLRKAGITYSVEPAGDGQYFLHFQGKDRDHTMHAVNRAFERMGLEFNTDDLVVHDETRTKEQTRNDGERTESTGQEEQAHASAERNDTGEHSAPASKPIPAVPIPNEPDRTAPAAPGKTGTDQGTRRQLLPKQTRASNKPSKRRRAPRPLPEHREAFLASFKKPPQPAMPQPKPPLPKPSHKQSR